jgi:hypothetical protein
MRYWLLIGGILTGLPAVADEPQPKPEASKTQRLDFPSGGTLRLEKSIGTLTIEGWDRPDMEITTTAPKSVAISAERRGNEVVVDTKYPKPAIPRNPFIGGSNFTVEYTIMVPSSAKLVVHHQVGQVNADGLSGDVDATLMQGEILLHLPQDGRYVINANVDYGTVNSDFPGTERHRGWFLGHRFISQAAAPHKLNLHVLSGDIVLLKIQEPKEPPPLLPAPAGNGK